MVWPTNSGKIVESRDQVRIICFCLLRLSLSILSNSFWSTKGPFFVDRDICPPSHQPQADGYLLFASSHNELICLLIVTRARPHGRFAPFRLRLSTDGSPSLSPAVGMVPGVHDRATDRGAAAQVTRAARLADGLVLVVEVADLADGGPRLHRDQAHLTGGHAHGGVVAFAGHQLRSTPGRAHQLGPTAGIQLDVVHGRAQRDVAQGQAIADADLGIRSAHQAIADLEAIGRRDVALLAIFIEQQRDARRAVGVVLDGRHTGRHAVFVALEVDEAVQALVPAAAVAGRYASLVVAAGLRLEGTQERLVWLSRRDVIERHHGHAAAAGRGGLVPFNSHSLTPSRRNLRCSARGRASRRPSSRRTYSRGVSRRPFLWAAWSSC